MSEDEPSGVDVSLIEAMMALTVEQRLRQNDRMIRMALRLREAFRLADQGAHDRAE